MSVCSGRKRNTYELDNPADDKKSDNWDHVPFDPVHRLVLGVFPGKRTEENTRADGLRVSS